MLGHTLLFSCLLVLAGIYLNQKRRDIGALSLASGSLSISSKTRCGGDLKLFYDLYLVGVFQEVLLITQVLNT
jgi:hypothetical protein